MVPNVITKKDGVERCYDIYSRLLADRIVFLTGEIDDAVADTVVAQILFLDSEDNEKDINLYINSPGGSVTAGMAIYDTIRMVKSNVHTICVGQACSMGAILLSGGDRRSALPHSRVMIHQPSGGAQGKATDILITAREIEKIRTMTAEILARHTGKKPEQILADIEKDNFMSAEEALGYGLVDEVLKEAE